MTPDEFTNEELMLEVGDGHTLYVQDWGKKDAERPVLFLHGGPGSGCKDKHKQQFDPERQRVIFFDQRGSGRSLPLGSLENNDTEHQIADIDKLLGHFNIQQVILTGGSWGSALAFYYAIARAQRVTAMLLDGIYTGSYAENAWLDQGGFRTFFPEVWNRYVNSVPDPHRSDPSRYHFERILGDDAEASKQSGYDYERLESEAMSLDDRYMPQDFETYDPEGIRVEVHYLSQNCFVPDRYVLDNASKLAMPIYLVQGRYDMICPPVTAYELSRSLPNSEIIWTTSGHKAERETWNVKRNILLQITQ